MKQALAKVHNPNVLVNLVSRRVRQLTSNGGGARPLIGDTQGMGAADIALTEIVEDKMGWAASDVVEVDPAEKKNRKI
jgi:DNA-directed RNA polymerase subunit omega